MIRVNTIATLDGSIRTVELGTLEAIELCEHAARTSGRAARNFRTWATLAIHALDALDAYRRTQSDDELTASNAREELEWIMHDTEQAMYDLGYLAYWHESTFYIETTDNGSETD